MPVATYEPIETVTLGSTQSEVTFSTISSDYAHLVIHAQPIGSTPNYTGIRFNGDSGNNYSRIVVSINGLTSGTDIRSNRSMLELDYFETIGTSIQYGTIIDICGANSTAFYKSAIARPFADGSGGSSGGAAFATGTWRNTAAISSVTVVPSSGSWASGSIFTLFGIKAAA